MQDISDDIIVQASEGDLAAFEVIYKAMSGFVYNVALRIICNREDAQEVTQEVFLIMHQKLKEFRFESSLKTWMYRIAVNCALNSFRKTANLKNKFVEYEDTPETVIDSETHQAIEKEHFNTLVDKALSVLNPKQRACIVLRNIEGLSYEEIAKALGVNVNTVRSNLKRAREKMLFTHKRVDYEYL